MMTPTGIVQPEDAKYIKRRVKSGAIDVHPSEPALIVNYEVEAIILGESENPVLSDKKQCQKIIRLKCLNKNSDCARLAREVVSKCSLIHPSKVADVEHLIYFLQSRKENAFIGNFSDGMSSSGSTNGYESPNSVMSTSSGEKATYANLDQYVALLYDDLTDKIKGSSYIMQLSLETDNLGELSRSDPVLSALARVLREDYKRSIDLSVNILSIFHSFSCFNQFHPLILQYKIGSLSISILEYELPLYAQWKSEIQFQRGRDMVPVSRLPIPKSARPSSQTPSGDRKRSSTPSAGQSADRKKLSLIPAPKTAQLPRSPSTPDDESIQKKTLMIAKQDRLLKVNFFLLMNIAENLKVEDKIRKRNIVKMLVECLDRNSVPLLVIIAKFLTKLSIRVENKDEMAKLNVIEKLPKLLQMNNFELEQATLQLLFNLSFDTDLREKMIIVGFLQKLASLLSDERHLSILLKILYHLSMEDKVKAMFTFTNCLPKLMNMLISFDRNSEDFINLVALCINVAMNPRCAETMCENGSLEHLKQRVLAYQDALLMKVLRNLSLHETTKKHFLAFAEELFLILPNCENEDYLLEMTGTVANLPLSELGNLSQIVSNNSFLLWIQQGLKPNREDDFVLELVMLIGAIAADETCAEILCNANIISGLIELLNRKQEDDEIVLQIIYTFYQASRHLNSRNYLMKKTAAIDYLIDLMNDKNVNIRNVCDSCIDIIREEDEEYEERVKLEKFQAHNAHWLNMVENKALETSLSSLSDYREAMPNYDLNQSLMLNTGSHVSLANVDDIEIISNNPNSDEGSRPLSRYDSDGDEFSDSFMMVKKKSYNNDELVRNALHNLILADDASDSHQFYHVDSPNTQVSMS